MKNPDPIQQTIEAALKEAELHDPASEDYTTIARNVETLAKAKALGESKKLSKDAILGAATSLARHRKDTLMTLSPAAAQAALDYAEELAATGLSSEQYDHYYL